MKLDLERQPTGRSMNEVAIGCKVTTDLGTRLFLDVTGNLTVDNLGQRFLVTGSMNAAGQTDCDRCLSTFTLQFDVPVEITVLRDLESSEGEGDTCVIQQKTAVVDLSDALHEATILAFPAKLVCREDCRGLCVQCGANLNESQCDCTEEDEDPRWAGLPE